MQKETLFISNETFKVDWTIHDEWITWIHHSFLSKMRQLEIVQWIRLVKILEIEQEEGPTYAIQAGFYSKADYNRYIQVELPPLMQQAYGQWKGQFIGFKTLMEVLN